MAGLGERADGKSDPAADRRADSGHEIYRGALLSTTRTCADPNRIIGTLPGVLRDGLRETWLRASVIIRYSQLPRLAAAPHEATPAEEP
jgi:hypothetical protein